MGFISKLPMALALLDENCNAANNKNYENENRSFDNPLQFINVGARSNRRGGRHEQWGFGHKFGQHGKWFFQFRHLQ